MNKASHPRDEIDKLYVLRKQGGKGFASFEDSVDTSISRLEDYMKKSKEIFVTSTRNNTNNTRINRKLISRKQKSEEKQLLYFKQQTREISHEKTWTRLWKRNLKSETESFLVAAQNNAIRTNYLKAEIAKTQQNCKRKLCRDRDETINLIISARLKLAQKECKTRHDWVGKVIHRSCAKNLTRRISGTGTTLNLYWDIKIQMVYIVSARWPEQVIVNKKEKLSNCGLWRPLRLKRENKIKRKERYVPRPCKKSKKIIYGT